MAKKVSVQKPGLQKKAAVAKRALDEILDRLADTEGSHAQASTDLSTARTAVAALIVDLAALE